MEDDTLVVGRNGLGVGMDWEGGFPFLGRRGGRNGGEAAIEM